MSVTVYQFWSPTCAPCNAIKPMMEDLKEEYLGKVTWVSVNTHDDKEGYAEKYDISMVPAMVVVAGNSIERHLGTRVAEYYRIIRNGIRISQQS